MSERRVCSVLFCDVVGFTPLPESRDPEAIRELLRRGDSDAAALAISEAREIGQRLRCRPLLDRADAIERAGPRVRA